MKRKRPRRLTSDEIALIRNSPMVIKKREEALAVIKSQQHKRHTEARDKKRRANQPAGL